MCAGNGLPRQDGREGLEIGPAVHGRDPRAARSGPHERRSGARGKNLWVSGAIVGPTTRTVALELDAVGVVNDAVQYGLAECGVGNHVMPLRHGGLTCDQQ